jgi:glycosyltransferase involved in cell wall biosynthesis
MFTGPDVWTREQIEHFYESYMLADIAEYLKVHANEFDIVHLHSLQHAAHFAKHVPLPMVYTVHDPLSPLFKTMYEMYQDQPNVHLVSVSDNQRHTTAHLPWLRTIHNGVDVDSYPFREQPENHVMFAGRMLVEKGPHRAVQAAQLAEVPLKLYGPYNDYDIHNQVFWDRKIKPHLGQTITHEGYLLRERLAAEYGRARALLMPISWEEPFGLVSIEALASGTPVIGFRRGSLPEIIEDGVTGFLVDTVEEMAAAIERIDTISRYECRAQAERRFSQPRLLDDYENAYRSVLGGAV